MIPRHPLQVFPILFAICAQSLASAREPVRVIYDTDMAGDCDDVGALAVLHILADRGECEIVACTISSNNPWSAGCVDAINTWYGRPDVPIGVASTFRGEPASDKPIDSKYTEEVATEFPHDTIDANELPSAVELYRNVLAAQPDGSVTIVSVGFLNNLAALLESPADEVSPLTGGELVKAKVKQWVAMAGVFPKGKFDNGHGEYNLEVLPKSAQHALNHWPTPLVLSGWEIGEPVLTGAALSDKPANNPIRRGYELYTGLKDRNSWDQTAVLYAIRGPQKYWKLSPAGSVHVPNESDGVHTWTDSPTGRHHYLIAVAPPQEVAEGIDELMMVEPKRK
jgi:purine nucleosidase